MTVKCIEPNISREVSDVVQPTYHAPRYDTSFTQGPFRVLE